MSHISWKPRPVYFLVYDGFNFLDLAGPMQVFETAGLLIGTTDQHNCHIVTLKGGPVLSSGGVTLEAMAAPSLLPANAIMIVIGGDGVKAAVNDRELIDWVKEQAFRIQDIGSVCTGAFILAEAGVLNGRRATTHWIACDELKQRYSSIVVELDRIYVHDGNVWTSAGVSAGIDLALAIVEQDQGRALASAVAQRLVVYLRRPGGQAQFSSFLELARRDETGKFEELHNWIRMNMARPISIADLADQAAMSERSLSRHYNTAMRMTPKQGLNFVRAEAARTLLQTSKMSLNRVARTCGFNSVETMDRVLKQIFGVQAARLRTGQS
jgi:transcriptional regulator GlxA family with amidase domain